MVNNKVIHGFTQDECSTLRNVIDSTWNHIAGDMFLNDEGEFDPSITFTRYEVAEISLDADRWRGGVSKNEENYREELIRKLYTLDVEDMEEVLDHALPYRTYGY